jgi:hypothetical protein
MSIAECLRSFHCHKPPRYFRPVKKIVLSRDEKHLPPVEPAQKERNHVDGHMDRAGEIVVLFVLGHPVGLKQVVADKMGIDPMHGPVHNAPFLCEIRLEWAFNLRPAHAMKQYQLKFV